MLTRLELTNIRSFRHAVLEPGPLTVLVGPNGSGKSTVLDALEVFGSWASPRHAIHERAYDDIARLRRTAADQARLSAVWQGPQHALAATIGAGVGQALADEGDVGAWRRELSTSGRPFVAVFDFDPYLLSGQAAIGSTRLNRRGDNLASVVENLLTNDRDLFDELEREFCEWIPQFDRIQLPTHGNHKRVAFRTRNGHEQIMATAAGHGTVLALAVLVLTHAPDPPHLLCLEEPDKGIHPRLMRNVHECLQRLACPVDRAREPVQVVVTTHSPYLLDCFNDTPEQVVVVERKSPDESVLRPLKGLPNREEILSGGASLGEIWSCWWRDR